MKQSREWEKNSVIRYLSLSPFCILRPACVQETTCNVPSQDSTNLTLSCSDWAESVSESLDADVFDSMKLGAEMHTWIRTPKLHSNESIGVDNRQDSNETHAQKSHPRQGAHRP